MAEYLFLEVTVDSIKLLLGVVYRPPGLNNDFVYQKYVMCYHR
jgi:hypothetical protein